MGENSGKVSKLLAAIYRSSVLKFSLPLGPMLTKTKNIRKKIKKKFFSKIQKTSERMAQGKPQIKFERNPCIKFRDNCDTDGQRTDGQIAIS